MAPGAVSVELVQVLLDMGESLRSGIREDLKAMEERLTTERHREWQAHRLEHGQMRRDCVDRMGPLQTFLSREERAELVHTIRFEPWVRSWRWAVRNRRGLLTIGASLLALLGLVGIDQLIH